jgi:hypothetical protein
MKKKLTNLDTDQSNETKAVPPKAPKPQRKVTPATFAAQEKRKENSKIKSAETAAVENHYVNGSFTHSTSNRGK